MCVCGACQNGRIRAEAFDHYHSVCCLGRKKPSHAKYITHAPDCVVYMAGLYDMTASNRDGNYGLYTACTMHTMYRTSGTNFEGKNAVNKHYYLPIVIIHVHVCCCTLYGIHVHAHVHVNTMHPLSTHAELSTQGNNRLPHRLKHVQ